MKFLQSHPVYTLLLLLLILLLGWVLWGNSALVCTPYPIASPKLPQAFDGFRIVQVSDFHNTRFGADNRRLLAMLEDARPDMIAITGDMIDSRRTNTEVAIAFAREAMKIAPVYYAPGNHESRLPEDYAALKAALSQMGVTVLENESVPLEKDGQVLTVTGLTDPDFGIPWPDLSTTTYQLVLSHRPELLDLYAGYGFDLVLTGHAHGGQIRLPGIGGLLAPHQGFFPRYTSGVHYQDTTAMVISRGLGNRQFPWRFCNRPELVLITLESV